MLLVWVSCAILRTSYLFALSHSYLPPVQSVRLLILLCILLQRLEREKNCHLHMLAQAVCSAGKIVAEKQRAGLGTQPWRTPLVTALWSE